MNEILITQIIAISTTATMWLWLLFCPYSGKEFENYNKSRLLFMLALAVLVAQYVVNMKWGFRAQNIEHGITANLFFYIPASYSFMVGMLNLQKAGFLRPSIVRHGIGITLFCYAFLLAGIYYDGGRYQWLANIMGSAALLLNQNYFGLLMLKDYKHTKDKIDDYFPFPAEEHVRWMRHGSVLAIVSFMLIPIAIHFAHMLTVCGILFWFAIIYYVARFTYYGRYVNIVDESYLNDDVLTEEQAIADEPTAAVAQTVANMAAEADPATLHNDAAAAVPEADAVLQQRIDAWIAEDRYSDNGVNIVQLAQHLGTNRTTLSRHINSVLGMNFREWINGLRIDKAKNLFRQMPQLSVEEVSTQCGFSTRKYFDQVFAAREGATAAEWRKR